MLKRIKWPEYLETMGKWPQTSFVADFKWYDIPNTVVAAINNMPEHCVAFSAKSLSARHNRAIEKVARKKNLRVIWV